MVSYFLKIGVLSGCDWIENQVCDEFNDSDCLVLSGQAIKFEFLLHVYLNLFESKTFCLVVRLQQKLQKKSQLSLWKS